jgi:hypothetical protein
MAVTVWMLMVIGLTLPSSPAQLGTTQLAFTLGLFLALNETEVPFAASVVYTCCVNIPYMIIGAVYWMRFGRIDRRIASNTFPGGINRRQNKNIQ